MCMGIAGWSIFRVSLCSVLSFVEHAARRSPLADQRIDQLTGLAGFGRGIPALDLPVIAKCHERFQGAFWLGQRGEKLALDGRKDL